MDEETARGIAESEASALEERRERRKVKGIGNKRARCEACCRLLKSDARPCGSCGYLKGCGVRSVSLVGFKAQNHEQQVLVHCPRSHVDDRAATAEVEPYRRSGAPRRVVRSGPQRDPR